ncbi:MULTISPECIES: L-lactate permease [unclassified Halorubrum]|uniref:L-lactate permease n=1 Tax=unclassified Halorubrum TaxID=2642239 RepID=UPI000B989266|nr:MULTISPECIES: L-lactate permease [unclassified Halorubrum]OYR42408.1 lactate permease [Halorubrum sp. Hd13]OYR51803.1 lactate permease [Halorubrum sp. Ea8]
MTTGIDVAVAAIPLLLAGILLVGFLWPATRAMPIAWVAALAVGYFAWNMPVNWLAAASAVGVITAITILWIVFGALVLLYTLMEAGAFDRINRGFATVSDDRRVQIVLIAFFMATFIEGAAGFGTPAAVVAPLLLGLGFPALAAVVAGIIGHIIAVTYGAVGTPIIVGIQNPMENVEFTRTAIEEGGMTVQEFSVEVAAWAATYHALVGFMMPLFAVGMVVYFFGDPDDRSLAPAWEVAPLCLFAGISFAVPYWISAWFLTAEFPALIGSMVGGTIVLSVLRAGYFLPDDEWEFPERERWADHWVGTIEPGQSNGSNGGSPEAEAADLSGGEDMSLLKAWSPYVALVILLVITRAVDPISNFIGSDLFVIGFSDLFGTTLGGSFAWMSVPGFWLIVSAVLAIPIFGMSGQEVSDAWKEAGRKIVSPFIALVFVIAMVQVMLQSGAHPGAPEVGSMIVLLAQTTADTLGPAYPAFASLIGALGAAMAGSNTVSNITFGAFQFEAATQLGLPRTIIVGAQAVGGAIGNLVAIHNLVAALATVGLLGQEGRVMRLNLIPLLYYATGVGLLCLLFSYVLFSGIF